MAATTKKMAKSGKSSKSTRKAQKAERRSRLEAFGYDSHEAMIAKARSVQLDDGMRIKVLVKDNPKRGKSAKRYAGYLKAKGVLTVAKARELGLTTGDLKYDVAHKYISLSKQ